MNNAIEAAAQAAYTEWLKPSSDTSWANVARAALRAMLAKVNKP